MSAGLIKRSRIFMTGYLLFMTSSLRYRLLSLALCALLITLLTVAAIWQIDRKLSLASQKREIQRINSVLEDILTVRFTNTSEMLAKTDTIVSLLQGKLSDTSRDVVLRLDTAQQVSGADIVFVLDRNGVLVAASGHPKKQQLMYVSHTIRPYFKAAMEGRSMLYAAVGLSTKERGVYFSSPVLDPSGRKTMGTVVFKASLSDVDRLFQGQQEIVLLTSPDGVVFSTNRPGWLYRTCHKLDQVTIDRIYSEKQFPDTYELLPLPVILAGDVRNVHLEGVNYDVHKKDTVIPGWQLVMLTSYAFPLSALLMAGLIITLLAIMAALYLVNIEKKRSLQHDYDKQTLDLNRTRRELVRNDELLQAVVEDQAELICRFDADHRITFVNGAFCRYFGKERTELVGSRFSPVFAGDDLQKVRQQFRELTAEHPVGEVEYRIVLPGKGIRWHGATIRKIFNTDGAVSEYQTVSWDITARKHDEEALREANSELTQFAYVVSHDLRAPLRAIHNYTDFISEDVGPVLQEEQRLYLTRLKMAVSEAETLIDDVLDLSRVSRCSINPVSVDMQVFLQGLIVILELGKDVHVDMTGQWPVIEAEPVLLKQIFQNLLINAAKYNQSQEKRIELGCLSSEEEYYDFYVRDNGIGIDKRYHEQIFRVFERLHTRDEYEGTGAGLAIVKKAVSRLHGSIWLESEPDSGSTFFVRLPLSQKEMKA